VLCCKTASAITKTVRAPSSPHGKLPTLQDLPISTNIVIVQRRCNGELLIVVEGGHVPSKPTWLASLLLLGRAHAGCRQSDRNA
jgi:hypothetical protein